MCQNLNFTWKIGKNLSNSHCLTPFLSSHWMFPFFWEKSLTKRPILSSCCPSTPVTSKVESPQSNEDQIKIKVLMSLYRSICQVIQGYIFISSSHLHWQKMVQTHQKLIFVWSSAGLHQTIVCMGHNHNLSWALFFQGLKLMNKLRRFQLYVAFTLISEGGLQQIP